MPDRLFQQVVHLAEDAAGTSRKRAGDQAWGACGYAKHEIGTVVVSQPADESRLMELIPVNLRDYCHQRRETDIQRIVL